MKKLVCLFSGLIAAAPAFALARPPSPARPVEAAPAARHLSFDRSETVLGRGLGPNGDAIEAERALAPLKLDRGARGFSARAPEVGARSLTVGPAAICRRGRARRR